MRGVLNGLTLHDILGPEGAAVAIPEDFPRFSAAGCQDALDSLRELFWTHFIPEGPEWDNWLHGKDFFPQYPVLPSGPKAALWDEWLCAVSLWPDVQSGGLHERMASRWSHALRSRLMDGEGYVDTCNSVHGAFYAHPLGWPFPIWSQGSAAWGAHFSWKGAVGEEETRNGMSFRPPRLSTTEGWRIGGARAAGVEDWGWRILLEPGTAASIEPPPCAIDTAEAPFLQVRFRIDGAAEEARSAPHAYLEWSGDAEGPFPASRRMYFDSFETASGMCVALLPLHKHPAWKGTAARLRLRFPGPHAPDASLVLQAAFTQYDTRHNINNLNYVRACAQYFSWTFDLEFLRHTADRVRRALRSFLMEHNTDREGVVLTTWAGHDGRSSLVVHGDGSRTAHPGRGLPNNYWDIIPFGHLDAYATVHFYDALRTVAELEDAVRAHPEWNVPLGALALDPEGLRQRALRAREAGNRLFWNPEAGRFAAGVDADGVMHDYGFTSLNLEAVRYGFASDEHARSILSWISGERTVEADTSVGTDIYTHRFAPRTTTRRNLDYWYWGYRHPERTPFGSQIQDGGAVLGFSYYDVMARLLVLGPDDAWARLAEIARWFRETREAGGYREYYRARGGTLQGANVGGGLGIENEFFESVMVPRALFDGFAGFTALPDGFRLDPHLPRGWPDLAVENVRFQQWRLRLEVRQDSAEIGFVHDYEPGLDRALRVLLPSERRWKCIGLSPGGAVTEIEVHAGDGEPWADVEPARLKSLRIDAI